MESCAQTAGLNTLQHGQLVHSHYQQLISAPDCCIKSHAAREYLQRVKLPPSEVLKSYHVYHDAGKWACLTLDEDGKRHFPNHAAVSAEQFDLIFPDDGFTRNLILRDMDFHTLRGADLDALCRHPLAPILYFTAWAELNANASMFGGPDSTSYKIKAKRLDQAGKKLLNLQGATS